MKKHLIAAALLGIGLAALATAPETLSAANTTTLGAPGVAGRPSQDSVTQARVEYVALRAPQDASLGSSFSLTSHTSVALAVTHNAGVSWAANSYAAPIRFKIVNTGLHGNIMAFLSMTRTAIVNGTGAGVVIKPFESGMVEAQPRSGLTLHLVAFNDPTSTATVSTETF